MDLNSGMLDGWETRVADSFNGLRAESPFLSACFVGLFFFFFFLISIEFLMDRQALGQKGRFLQFRPIYTESSFHLCVQRALHYGDSALLRKQSE